MQRGQKKSETGIDHLERNDFIIQKQENKKKQLQDEAKKAIAEKEEAEAEIEAAKTEVADLWKEHDYLTSFNRCSGEQARSFAMSAYIYRIDEGLQFFALQSGIAERCIKAIQDFAYSGFGGRGGKHGDIFWDNESNAIKHCLKMFAELASATLKQVTDWFVWLAGTLGRFFDERSGKAERNANELRRADHEVHDIADGRYDGRIQKYQQGMSR